MLGGRVQNWGCAWSWWWGRRLWSGEWEAILAGTASRWLCWEAMEGLSEYARTQAHFRTGDAIIDNLDYVHSRNYLWYNTSSLNYLWYNTSRAGEGVVWYTRLAMTLPLKTCENFVFHLSSFLSLSFYYFPSLPPSVPPISFTLPSLSLAPPFFIPLSFSPPSSLSSLFPYIPTPPTSPRSTLMTVVNRQTRKRLP